MTTDHGSSVGPPCHRRIAESNDCGTTSFHIAFWANFNVSRCSLFRPLTSTFAGWGLENHIRSEPVCVGVARRDGALRDSVYAVMFQSLILSQAVPMDGGPVVGKFVYHRDL